MSKYQYTLLTAEEYEQHIFIIPQIHKPWWLRSHGYNSTYASYVTTYGGLNNDNYVNFTLGIRPALLISNPESIYNYGSEITVGKYKWTVLRSNEKECYALCTEIVAHRCFDTKSNDFETSEIKHWLDNEFAQENSIKSCIINEIDLAANKFSKAIDALNSVLCLYWEHIAPKLPHDTNPHTIEHKIAEYCRNGGDGEIENVFEFFRKLE